MATISGVFLGVGKFKACYIIFQVTNSSFSLLIDTKKGSLLSYYLVKAEHTAVIESAIFESIK